MMKSRQWTTMIAFAAIVAASAPTDTFAASEEEIARATVKVGQLRFERGDARAVVTVENVSSIFEKSVGIECAALVDGEPIETHVFVAASIPRGRKAYETVDFLDLGDHRDAKITCRVDSVDSDD